MNARLLPLLLLVLLARPIAAQVAVVSPSTATPPQAAPIQMTASDRQFFALGLTLSQGAFAYAELAKQATAVSHTRSKIAQMSQLGKLAPVAQRNRLAAGDALAQTLALMRNMNAPGTALEPVRRAAARLTAPLALTSDARPLALFNAQAAQTLSSLSEFETLSSLPEDPALRKWLASPGVSDAAQVWYGEGEIAALAQIAAARQMPELLPPAEQIATDLRGLRDWLALRLPDSPTPDQAALKASLEAFLRDARPVEPGRKSRKPLSSPQLQALGAISRLLQAQVLGPEAVAPKAAAPKAAASP